MDMPWKYHGNMEMPCYMMEIWNYDANTIVEVSMPQITTNSISPQFLSAPLWPDILFPAPGRELNKLGEQFVSYGCWKKSCT